MKKLICFIILLSLNNVKVFSQTTADTSGFANNTDTLLLIDGNIIIAKMVDTSGGVVRYKTLKRPKKTHYLEIEEVFSWYSKGKETIIYQMDTVNDFPENYVPEEMRYFIWGQQDARKQVKAPIASAANFLVSGAAGATGSLLSAVVPFACAALFGIPRVNIDQHKIDNIEKLNHASYITGYKQEAYKQKKIKTLFSGGIGLFAGIGTSFILRANNMELLK